MITAVGFVAAAGVAAVVRGLAATTAWRMVAINVLGSFLLGLVANFDDPQLTVLGVGVLGSLTTFSGFIAAIGQSLDGGASAQEPGATAKASPERAHPLTLLIVGALGGVAAAWVGLTI